MSTTKTSPRVYLAGPEVFLSHAHDIGARKVKSCALHGLVGLFPLDQSLDLTDLAPAVRARTIALANEDLMRSADALIANMTPFRGASMDCGTAFEVGFMRALGRPVFGYTGAVDDYRTRVERFRRDAPGWRDGDRPGTHIEDFGLAENLMIDIAIGESGHVPVRGEGGSGDIGDLAAFEACLAAVAPLIIGDAL